MSLTNDDIREFTLMALDQPPAYFKESPIKLPFTVNTPWWVDYNGYIYDKNGSVLRIRDGITGEIIANDEPCYDIKIYDGVLGTCVVQRSNEDNYETWKFRHYNGEITGPIKMPFIARSSGVYFTTTYKPKWGYRNGIFAISNDYNSSKVWTYSHDGDGPLFETKSIGMTAYPGISQIFPITPYLVGVLVSHVTNDIYYQMGLTGYALLSDTETDILYHLFSSYYPYSRAQSQNCTYLGRDENYFYVCNQLHDRYDSSILLSDWVIAKFRINDGYGPIEISRFDDSLKRSWSLFTEFGNISYRDKNLTVSASTSYYFGNLAKLSNMRYAYSGRFNMDLQNATTYDVLENSECVWIRLNSGLYYYKK